MTVWIYDQGEELKVFATEDAARAWIEANDPELHDAAVVAALEQYLAVYPEY